jgi:phosphoglucomutase
VRNELDHLDGTVPLTITYDVYLNANNQLRRIYYEMPFLNSSISADMVVATIGVPVDEVPTGSDVFVRGT